MSKARRRAKYPKAKAGAKILAHPASRTLATAAGSGWLTLRFDGGVDRNGKPDAAGKWAFIASVPTGGRLVSDSGMAEGEPVTVNTCEWEGLWNGLVSVQTYAPHLRRHSIGLSGLLIEGDSDLVISQLTGRWGCSSDVLRGWRDRCLDLLAELYAPWHARWIPRERNAECDALTKRRPSRAED